MRKNSLYYIPTLLLLLLVVSACHHDQPELGVDFSNLDNGGKYFVPFSEEDHDVRQEQPWNKLPEDWEASSTSPDSSVVAGVAPRGASSLNMTDLARGIIESLTSYKVHQVAGTYMSRDIDGNPIKVSGAIFYPTSGTIKNVIICSHYTVSANYEVPSQTFPIEAMFAALGYVVVMPDYIGYGITADKVHPYLQADVTASNVIDMALAVRPFLAERNIRVQHEEVIILGYSQGGSTSMYVQFLMETDPTYQGKFKILRNYCGGGPYHVARTYDYVVSQKVTGIPYAVPMIILGMSEGMSIPLNIDLFFKEPLLSNYQEWLNTKKYSGTQITELIGTKNLENILTPMGLDRKQPETQRLYRELLKNSMPNRYLPVAPIYMFHSMDDQTVPFINAQIMHGNFQMVGATNVEYDFDHYGSHQNGCIKFILKVFKFLK